MNQAIWHRRCHICTRMLDERDGTEATICHLCATPGTVESGPPDADTSIRRQLEQQLLSFLGKACDCLEFVHQELTADQGWDGATAAAFSHGKKGAEDDAKTIELLRSRLEDSEHEKSVLRNELSEAKLKIINLQKQVADGTF